MTMKRKQKLFIGLGMLAVGLAFGGLAWVTQSYEPLLGTGVCGFFGISTTA